MKKLFLLEKQEIITYREGADHELLMDIRNGKFMKPDGTYNSEFFELLDTYTSRMKYAEQHTELPEQPDYETVNELLIQINQSTVSQIDYTNIFA